MSAPLSIRRQMQLQQQFAVRFLSFLVGAHGLYILAVTLLDQLAVRRGTRVSNSDVDLPLLIGMGLLYLSTLLRRQKRTAWLVTIMAYVFYLGLGASRLLDSIALHSVTILELIRALLLPAIVVGLLFAFQKQFVVRSDVQGFRSALSFVIIVFMATILYGTAGFLLLDNRDFHQEITVISAAHYTVDQFNITTGHPAVPHTKRAHLFSDSLSFISLAALGYAAISLFQPLRTRFAPRSEERELMARLLAIQQAPSEEFFKLWPHDKQYFFDATNESGLAFSVQRGTALCLSDPAGDKRRFNKLLDDFQALCFYNDWLPAFVHVGGQNRRLYESHGFVLQKLGEDAVVDVRHFQQNLIKSKYFRQIRNKFNKQGFVCEILAPPHHQALLSRLRTVSDEWLRQGNRAERGFAMGYYNEDYLQLCRIVVVKDAAGTIQAFANLVPAEFDTQEATYDLLRRSAVSVGNITDFLLLELIGKLAGEGYIRLNLGLCPLVGLGKVPSEQRGIIDSVLYFAYANGDRFYSFDGLRRFKAKYEPEWQDKYVAYQPGLRSFSRAMAGLMRAMRR